MAVEVLLHPVTSAATSAATHTNDRRCLCTPAGHHPCWADHRARCPQRTGPTALRGLASRRTAL